MHDEVVYLAGPYSHPQAAIREMRFEMLTKAAADLMLGGSVVYSPITHGHTVTTRHDLPLEWDFWRRQSLAMLKGSDRLIVVMLEGWRDSVGVTAEVEHAQNLGIPINYIYAGTDAP